MKLAFIVHSHGCGVFHSSIPTCQLQYRRLAENRDGSSLTACDKWARHELGDTNDMLRVGSVINLSFEPVGIRAEVNGLVALGSGHSRSELRPQNERISEETRCQSCAAKPAPPCPWLDRVVLYPFLFLVRTILPAPRSIPYRLSFPCCILVGLLGVLPASLFLRSCG